jgi:hypothetical protein
VQTEPGYGFTYIFNHGCTPQFTVDLFRPAWQDGVPDGSRFPMGPYVNAAAITADPATIVYGAGLDQTIDLTFVGQHVFRQYFPPLPGNPEFAEYEPMIYWAPDVIHYPFFTEYAERHRNAAGVFGAWQLKAFNSVPPFTLTPAATCGGSTASGPVIYSLTPTTCPFTLHWTRALADDMQVLYPVSYSAIRTSDFEHGIAGGYTWVAMSAVGVLPPLGVTLEGGVSNGNVFSVDVTVTNRSVEPLTDVTFDDPAGIVPLTAGRVTTHSAPEPPLPSTLGAGESFTLTVKLKVAANGTVDLEAVVTATDGDAAAQSATAQAHVEIGTRRLESSELQRVYSDALMDASQTDGALLNALQARVGLITAWASGPDGTDTVPPWINVSVTEPAVPPPGTRLAEPTFWQVSAARSLGLDDRAFTWVPNDAVVAQQAYIALVDRFALAGGKVIDDTGNAAYRALRYSGQFYQLLASGDEAFRAQASRDFNSLVHDAGDTAADTITLLGAIVAFSHDDPLGGDLRTYEKSPALQQFSKSSAAIIDAGLTAANDKLVKIGNRAKTDPVGAAGELGDVSGTLFTSLARDIVLAEVGAAGVTRLGRVIESSLALGRTGESIATGLEATDPAAAALTASVDPTGEIVARQTLESLGNNTVITLEQLEQLGGFYAADAEKVQQIVNEVNAKFNVNIEIQCRPGNPASLEFYRNGTGVPKPEWVKPKNTEWIDRLLGAPQDSLGKATVFRPTYPDAATLSRFSPDQQVLLLKRYETQAKLFKDATEPGGKFFQLLEDSKTAGGATYTTGFGSGAREVKGLRYSLRAVGEPGQEAYVVIDEAAGGKFVLSDADYQAVVDANTLKHLPAGKRGQIELELMNRLKQETSSFGGHGWSHSGFDLPSKYSEPFVQFVTESSTPAAARRTLEWFASKAEPPPAWLTKIGDALAVKLGRAATQAELVEALLDTFRPGSFVIKFNGTDLRVGYAAGIR